MTIEQFSKDFPVVSQYTYLNTAASGLMYEGLMEWRQNHDIDFLIGGSKFRESAGGQMEEIRAVVAHFFDAEIKHTLLTPNFSFGLKTLVNGMDKKQKILLLDEDYPSLNWPFKSSGFKEVISVPIVADLEERIAEAFREHQPTIFAFSIVQYISGVKVDLDFIDQLKKEYPDVLFVADATQYSGTEKFSFKNSGIDVYGGSGYKWLLAGYGNGYMLVKEHLSDQLFETSFEFEPQQEPFVKEKKHLESHFEPGHLDTLNIGSLGYSIQQLDGLGQEVVQKHLQEVAQYAKERFSELGLLSKTVMGRNQHAPIFNLNIDSKATESLKARNVVFSLRGAGVRVSFHLYNSIKDVDKVFNILKHSGT